AVDINNDSVSDIEVRMLPGATVSGVVIVEGVEETAAVMTKLSKWGFYARVLSQDHQSGRFVTSMIGGDGSFRIAGLRSGKIALMLSPLSPSATREFSILRIEQNGRVLSDGIAVGEGEQVSGVRVVLGVGGGVIRGQVTTTGGNLEGVSLYLYCRQVSGNQGGSTSAAVDSRGRFVIQNLVAGEYELMLGPMTVYTTGPEGGRTMSRMPTVKQTVSVRQGAESDVTILLSLKP
ncbi:MAG TPA: hypothetical protein VFV34_23860, partial [Blastocatellia bacterium]|nr:hypothetical protein [Blastocatellia bacterium]